MSRARCIVCRRRSVHPASGPQTFKLCGECWASYTMRRGSASAWAASRAWRFARAAKKERA
jgi:hypothetical protein